MYLYIQYVSLQFTGEINIRGTHWTFNFLTAMICISNNILNILILSKATKVLQPTTLRKMYFTITYK